MKLNKVKIVVTQNQTKNFALFEKFRLQNNLKILNFKKLFQKL